MKNELPAPQVPPTGKSMELIRVWLIDGSPSFVITPNLWNDPSAWGLLLADVMRHLGNAYEADGKSRSEVIARIKEVFDAEWDEPTSTADSV
jgi:hypothetical protein